MFVDARELNQDQVWETDLCIIGAGAAGITMAREFLATSREVTLLESGGLDYDDKTQSLYSGKNTGLPSFNLETNRLRFFGGTTNHWSGHCRPLDAIDFTQRDWLPNSGWPLDWKSLDPYYQRAQPVCGLGEYRYEELRYFTRHTGLPDLPLDHSRLQTAVYNQSPPTRFGQTYRDELRLAPNIKVLMYANVLRIDSDAGVRRITGLKVACIDGPRFRVRARVFVLATGGMENARILMLSDQVNPKGLGNDHDLVGRFFMDHILLRPGVDISFSRPQLDLRLYHRLHKVAGGQMFCILASTAELLRREQLTNFRIHVVPAKPKYRQPLGSVFSDIDEYPGENPAKMTKENSVGMHMVLEPVPNRRSRITLSAQRDFFGQRKINVRWLLTETDLRHAYRAMELAAMEFGRMGLGRAYGEILKNRKRWPDNMEAGKHHCGTTRMAEHASTGVVNRHCRVFNIDNLYIAGSSVFPTIGYANPTLTIVALSLRLADHLKERG